MERHRVGFLTKIIFYSASIVLDIVQIILDFFVIGVVINRIFDILFGLTIGFWLMWIQVGFMEAKSVWFSVLAAFAGDFIPILDVGPWWTADLYYAFKKIKVLDDEYNQQIKQKSEAEAAQHETKREEALQTLRSRQKTSTQ